MNGSKRQLFDIADEDYRETNDEERMSESLYIPRLLQQLTVY